MQLKGQVAYVTGACGDIGGAICLALACAGAKVVLNDIVKEHSAQALLDEIRNRGEEAIYCSADNSDPAAVRSLFESGQKAFGPPDICIGNAAIVESTPFLSLSSESWTRQLSVNLTGCFHFGQIAAQRMIDAGRKGRIIFTSSWVQDVPWENLTAYCAGKSGLKMLAKCMALELGRHGITVNLIAPGFVDGGLSGRLFKEQPGLREAATALVPLGYIMSPALVADAVMLLCSPGAGYMTGSTLLVDGGNSLFLREGNA
jgi:NAD(P)-dependent dehydrogenase (short-subunit alcohol dehydrogenase family)